MTSICIRCCGTGTYLGNGMMITDCELCNDDTMESKPQHVTLDKIDRKSASYKKAIKDIMKLNPKISHKDAVKMFDDAYVKE